MWTDISCTTMVVKHYPPHVQQCERIYPVQRRLSNITPHMVKNVNISLLYNDKHCPPHGQECEHIFPVQRRLSNISPTWSTMWTDLSCTTMVVNNHPLTWPTVWTNLSCTTMVVKHCRVPTLSKMWTAHEPIKPTHLWIQPFNEDIVVYYDLFIFVVWFTWRFSPAKGSLCQLRMHFRCYMYV